MPTQEYRFIIIENKVITRADVQKLANELYSLYNKKGRIKKKAIEFQVFCEENAVFKSGDPEIFSSNSPIISKRVMRIEMRAGFESEAISIQFQHDPSKSMDNSILVTGDDSNWVNGTLKKLEEIVDTFDPQNTIVKRYKNVMIFAFSLTIGLAIFNLFNLILSWIAPTPVLSLPEGTVEWIKNNVIYLMVLLYPVRYAAAMYVGVPPAVKLVRWLTNLFPSVELQIAPEYKLTEKKRRLQIASFISVTGIVTLFLQIAVDILKNIL